MRPDSHITRPLRLLVQFREVLRYKHYSLRTEQAYLYWIRFFIRWHGREGSMRHPRDMGAEPQFGNRLLNWPSSAALTNCARSAFQPSPQAW